MFLFDAHLDLAWNAIEWNRDLTLPLEAIRDREISRKMTAKARGVNTVSLPEMVHGRVGMVIGTLLARLIREHENPSFCRYDHMEAAHGAAMGQLAWYKAIEKRGLLKFIHTAKDLEESVATWSQPNQKRTDQSAQAAPPIGMILSMEGADPILDPSELETWWSLGLRIIGPAHYGVSPYAHGTSTIGGLFPQGPRLLKEMERLGFILDVTHLADQAFDEAIDLFGGPVLASHHNCRALVPDQRQLSDEQIKILIQRGAVIGAAFDAWMLIPGWQRGMTTVESSGVLLSHVADHVDHICQLAGNTRHVGLGSDLDGGFGKEQSPGDLESIADLQRIGEILAKRGYSESDITAFNHGNWIRFFRQAWKH